FYAQARAINWLLGLVTCWWRCAICAGVSCFKSDNRAGLPHGMIGPISIRLLCHPGSLGKSTVGQIRPGRRWKPRLRAYVVALCFLRWLAASLRSCDQAAACFLGAKSAQRLEPGNILCGLQRSSGSKT